MGAKKRLTQYVHAQEIVGVHRNQFPYLSTLCAITAVPSKCLEIASISELVSVKELNQLILATISSCRCYRKSLVLPFSEGEGNIFYK